MYLVSLFKVNVDSRVQAALLFLAQTSSPLDWMLQRYDACRLRASRF